MSFTPIPKGTENWDVPVNETFTDQDSRISVNASSIASNVANIATQAVVALSYRPTGIKAMIYPPELGVNSSQIGNGNICMMRMELLHDTTISNILAISGGAGSGLVAGQNFAALYGPDGTRLGITADQSTAWATAGFKEMPLTSPVSVAAGSYYVALMSNGTTRPSFSRAVSSSDWTDALNYGLTPETYRYAFGGIGQTVLPTVMDMSARTPLTVAHWAGIS